MQKAVNTLTKNTFFIFGATLAKSCDSINCTFFTQALSLPQSVVRALQINIREVIIVANAVLTKTKSSNSGHFLMRKITKFMKLI